MAQRMESVAPSGGVMLSESTARLVENAAAMDEPKLVRIKGSDYPGARIPTTPHRTPARQPGADPDDVGGQAVGEERHRRHAQASHQRARRCRRCGRSTRDRQEPPARVRSRATAAAEGVEVFSTFCESHAREIPFHAAARLLQGGDGRQPNSTPPAARAHVRALLHDTDSQDLQLLDDLLGIADPDGALPAVDPDARRRRLTALINAALLGRIKPAVYLIEDAHWIDEVSESMLADFLTVAPRTRSLVLITHRPEYHGSNWPIVPDAQTIALVPLR